MDQDLTQFQSPDDIEKAEKLSREGNQPPSDVPGYVIHGMIGSGAYGEVWSGTDRNTGRKVAIKFYSRRSTVDFSLLSREVEKLASLAADRYVVQLLDVGWESTPPYYVMDYIENGSLEDELRRRGPFSIEEATEMFQEVAIGLMHLHNKGILHCDLKPGNVLLDNDQKPRLADFGQSRLSNEQVPALGTLFYMAPEQANLEAVPDAKWDVYALGALMYCMLTGAPPYRNADNASELESASEIRERLARYQNMLKHSPDAKDHKEIPGIDKQLVEIIDRCIAVEPSRRFENVQGILLALRQREEMRARRPLLLLGMIGPFVLLCIMAYFGWALYNRSMDKAEIGLMEKAEDSNKWAAQFAARNAAHEIDAFFEAVHQLGHDPEFLRTFKAVLENEKLAAIREKLADPNALETNDPEVFKKYKQLIEEFRQNEDRLNLRPFLSKRIGDSRFKAASWFCSDAAGTQLAFVSDENPQTPRNANPRQEDESSIFGTVGKNYSWRTYFHGGSKDLKETQDNKTVYQVASDPSNRTHIDSSHMSAIFISQASKRWKVAFSIPIFEGEKFLGILAATAHCGDFVSFKNTENQYVMLVDFRNGPNRGAILAHPYYEKVAAKGEKLSNQILEEQKLDIELINEDRNRLLHDPLAARDETYEGEWVIGKSRINRSVFEAGEESKIETELYVFAAERCDSIREPVDELGRQILGLGVVSVGLIIVVGIGFWFLAIRSARESRERVNRVFRSATETATVIYSGSTHV